MSATPLFQLSRVGYEYPNGGVALRNIDLTLVAGECLALLGANGCGKSTLIKLLNGLQFPTSGQITALGQPLNERELRHPQTNSRFRSRVGYVFQNADAQLFSSTVYEELAFAPLQMGLNREEVAQRVHDIAELLRLTHLLERAPFQLSGGEKRKVCLGCVLTMNPEVLLLDEPTTGLDPRSQEELITLLQQLALTGKTLVVATHDLSLVGRLATRCVVMNEQHEVEAVGETKTILSNTALLRRVNLIA